MTRVAINSLIADPLKSTLSRDTRRNELSVTASEVLNEGALRQIAQVVDGVFAGDRLRQNRVIVIAGVDKQGESSLWLTAGVASSLTIRTGEAVHIFSVQGETNEGTVLQIDPLGAMAQDCTLERVSEMMLRREEKGGSYLNARVADLKATGHIVLIHVPNLARQFEFLEGIDRIDGAVLLIRAAHTRKTVLKSVQYLLNNAHISILGAVLLDRVYPIPEILYKML